jgi:hypothetical protein
LSWHYDNYRESDTGLATGGADKARDGICQQYAFRSGKKPPGRLKEPAFGVETRA